jgi:PAS domain S-box-containing protein
MPIPVALGERRMQEEILAPSRVLNWQELARIADSNCARYRDASPFPHIVLDGLFPDAVLDRAIAELPGPVADWTKYESVNEVKQVCSDVTAFGPAAEMLVHTLNSAPFVRFLEKLTGIEALIPDPHLHAAGYMKVPPGGHLGLHYDFATQRELKLERRINVLVYLNRDWRPEWGGQLELHSNDDHASPSHVSVDVEPLFNRMVIFSTPNALHGHRRPIACPPGRARLCLSWYYYTAIPALGWAAVDRRVSFPGRFELARSMTVAANMLTPPILFQALRRIRSQASSAARWLRRHDNQEGRANLATSREIAAGASGSAPVPAHSRAESGRPPAGQPAATGVLQPWESLNLLDFTNDVVIIWEMNGEGILYWNKAAESLYGYTREQALGRTTHDLLQTRLSGTISRMESELARFGVWVGKLHHRARDGREVHVEGRLALLSRHSGKWLVIEVNRDITDGVAADTAGRAMVRQLEELHAMRGRNRKFGG